MRAEAYVASQETPRSAWHNIFLAASIFGERHEVILAFNSNRIGPAMIGSPMIIGGCTGSAGRWGIIEPRQLRVAGVIPQVYWSRHWRRITRASTITYYMLAMLRQVLSCAELTLQYPFSHCG